MYVDVDNDGGLGRPQSSFNVGRVSPRNFTLGGKLTDCVAVGHSEGEGAGGGCAPSRAEHKRKFYLFLEDSFLANSPAIFTMPILY